MEKGIELHQFDKENKEDLEETLGKLSLSDSEKTRIKQDIEAGRLITIPDEDVTIGSWTGTGYISLDKTTGAGAYMISGSLNGGAKPAIATGMAVYALIMEFGSAYFLINALSLVLVPGIIKLAGVALIMQGIYVINMMLIAYIDYMATHDEAYFDQFVNWFLKSGLISSIQLECAYLLLSLFWVAEACDGEKEETNAEVETNPETTPETNPEATPETNPEINPVSGQTGGEEGNVGGSGTTKLYRAMSQAEYDSVIQNQKFVPYDLAMEDKWFATTQENATKWGNIFYPDGNYRILEVEVDTNSLNKMYYVDYLDNIGPAYCSPLDILEESIRSIKEVKR